MLPQLFNFSWEEVLACVYRPAFESFSGYFKPICDFHREIKLIGLDKEMASLKHNTQAFLQGEKASNVLLWGARGCGKSSLMQLSLSSFLHPRSPLRIIELSRESLGLMPMVQDCVRDLAYKFIIVCDDLYFEANNQNYKSLKSTLEGSFENKAQNVLFYTTSNHRHLINESYPQDTLHLNDAQDEILSLSDRFGLSIGFYTLSRVQYLELVEHFLQSPLDENLKLKALQFSTLKGSHSPRIAQEFCTLYHNGIF
ncbi:MAG: DUF815 domain-containing protein [Helicobacter sp.]|uniref:DUF815 domain-containing protein n=1 Tax=Helicobacter sp. TaxID=218 RepID=UPI0025BA6E91|nr:DUF815 domain-containing protein [Helicobacter sp.]MCH5312809.1 DUF815 domain-containing protein [Helicobacter sp.]